MWQILRDDLSVVCLCRYPGPGHWVVVAGFGESQLGVVEFRVHHDRARPATGAVGSPDVVTGADDGGLVAGRGGGGGVSLGVGGVSTVGGFGDG